jgi:nucleosome assembly protein 1-like 1
MAALTEKMAGLSVGDDDSSDGAEMASKGVLRCVQALRNLQDQTKEIKEAYVKECILLEQKYQALYKPLYDKRVPLISGEEAPKLSEEDESNIPEDAPDGGDAKGIPGFWLQALGQHPDISDYIAEEDLPLMQQITDISVTYSEDYSQFSVIFKFNENEFMEETELKKTYTVAPNIVEENATVTDFKGTEIHWKPGKNLTVTEVKKKQKAKGGKNKGQTRTIVSEEKKHSFFLYFGEPREEDDLLDDEDDYDAMTPGFDAEMDYDVACAIRSNIVPEALYWFTGENVEEEDDEDDEDDDEDWDEGDQEEEEEEEEQESKPRRNGRGKNKVPGASAPAFTFDPNALPPPPGGESGEKPECKQS